MSYKYTIPEGWAESELQEFCVKVADGTHDSPKRTEHGKLLVTSKNIIGGTLDLSKSYCISEDDFNEINRRSKVDINDVLLSMIGTVGEACLIDSEPDFAIKNVGLLKNDDPLKAQWLYFYLTSPQAQIQIKERLRGTTQQYLPLGEIRRFPIIYPRSRTEMQEVVEALAVLQNKIQLNHQINQTLEQMAQAIFKSWFVDFEPVKAKLAALEAGGSEEDALLAAMQAISGKGEAELTRLQAEQPEQYTELRATAELFPSAMQDSELGEIPEGWELSTIGEEFDVTMGQSPPGDTYNEEGDGVPFFQGRRDFGERFPSNRVYCSAPKRMANEGDTLLSVRAPVGDTNIALTNCCIGRGLAALRHKSGCSSYTYYSIIQLGQALSSYDSEGTVFGSINQKNLRAIPVVAPAIDVLAAFTRTVGSIDELIRVNSEEASTLADTRDTLLPKLLSGELSVPCNRDEIECEPLSTTPEVE